MMGAADRTDPHRTGPGRVPAALARLISLPPLGQGGRHRYAPFLRAALDLFEAHGAAVGFWVSPHEMRRIRVLAGEVSREAHEDVVEPGPEDGPARWALRQGSVVAAAAPATSSPEAGVDGFPGKTVRSALFIGLRMRDEPPAVLGVYRFGAEAFGAEARRLAEDLASVLAAALDNVRRFARAEELSITDGLTGVFNYRYLRSALDREVARAKRFREEFTIIMLDVDHLKDYNDVHGHLQGSEVLRRLAQLALAELRATDILAKYGGDEFVVILPQTRREGARVLAERIRVAVASHQFPGEGSGMKITTSMGIAQFPDDGEDTRDLVEAADRALYEAKRTGRDRVTACMPGGDKE